MTTTTSPDGQTNATTQTTSGSPPPNGQQATGDPAAGKGGDGEAIRNWGEVTKIIEQRQELKLKNEALERELAELKKPPAAAAPPASGAPPAKADDPLAELKTKLDKLEQERDQRTLTEKRKAITDVVLERVPEAHKDAVRAMVRLLEEEPGGIDLKSDDTQAQGNKALESLSKRHPSYFINPTGANVGTVAGATIDFSNMTWDQLPPDVQRGMSDEDFAKHFGPNAKKRTVSILGGGYTNGR